MNLTTQQQNEILQVYNTYWDNYIKGDVEAMHPLLADEYTQVGSAESEVFSNKKEAVQFLYDTIDQVAGKLEMRNRKTTLEQQEQAILIHEFCDLFALADGNWIFYSKFRASTFMQQKPAGWKITHQHSSFPDTKAEDGQNIAIDKIAAENQQLREAVKRRTIELEQKNRELEIETALEKVRAEAMGMNKPDDILAICKVMFTELHLLGFSQLRNTLINFWDDERSSLIDYDYSHETGGNKAILSYSSHPVFEQFQKTIKNSKDAFAELIVTNEQLESWKQRRRDSGEYEDPRLNHIDALYYYFYSIGVGAIGISTFSPITEEQLNVLKRFRNVFDFAYRRYADVAQAEAQAREAQIDAALERVRSQSMGMQSSKDFSKVTTEMFNQLRQFGGDLFATGIVFCDKHKDHVEQWHSLPDAGMLSPFIVPVNLDYIHQYRYDQWKKGVELFKIEIPADFIEQHFKDIFNLPSAQKVLKDFEDQNTPMPETPSWEIDYGASFKHGYLLVSSLQPFKEAEILPRFAKVFEQTYTRFLDLQKAEAQAREAQIEAALERVRSRSMAMHKSDELADLSLELVKQVQALGVATWFCAFNIYDDDSNSSIEWGSNGQGVFSKYRTPREAVFLRYYEAGQRGETLLINEIGEDEGPAHYEYLCSLPGVGDQLLKMKAAGIPFPKQQIDHVAFFKHGYIIFITYEPVPETHDIFKRFARVFEQSYTRFLDLKNAEAQAREAEIELGLERVRARAMAMQKSDELSDLVDTVFKELTKLDFALNWCIINIIDEPSLTNMVWAANPETNKPPESYLMKFEDYPFHHSMLKAYRERKTKHVYVIEGEEKTTYDNYLFGETEWRRVPQAAQDASRAMKRYVATFTFSNFGGLQTVGEEHLSEQNLDILSRFGKVFDLTYTRFNDLLKAEAQTREAQIEVAVERVRAKALAMHKSAEIMGVAVTMRKELETLNMPGFDAATITLKQDDGTIRLWDNTSAKQHEDGTWENTEFKFRLEDNHPDFYLNKIWSSNDRYIVVEQDEHDLKITTDWVRNHDKNLADVVVHYYKENGIKQAWHPAVALTYGRLNLDFYVHAPEPEVENILIKMAAAFDLAYKRFLDLQKAEAQAREAQIEAALERVRSRTMAMQRSEELPEVAGLLFQQVKALGVPQFHCGFNIFEIDDKECIWYPGSADGDILPPCKIPLTEHPVFINFIKSRKRGDELCVYEKEGEYQAGHYRYMLSLPVLGEILQNMLDAGISFPTFQIDHLANFSHGNLLFITSEHFPEMHDTFKRFAKVFEQTYTRFLDLQKAEAQAREAQIEAALEKVRSRSLAMQKPEELLEVAEVLRSEMGQLGVEELETSSIYIVDKEKMQAECWYAIKDIREENKQLVSDEMTITFADTWVGSEMGKFYRSKKEHTSIVMKGDNRKEWINYCAGKSNVLQGYYGDEIPERTYHLVKFNGGYMGAASPGDISAESWDLLRRAASVFSLAYTRFNDLQIAEAHARQAEQDLIAIKEAKQKAEEALTELQATQKQLIQAEKMASLGELTAGIAHEIQNPLNFVNNFSEVSKELLDEMKEAIEKGDTEDAKEIMNDVIRNLEKINHHGKRADGIVKGMLQHSSSGSGKKEPTDINALADEYLRLAYHGLRAKDKSFNATMKTNFDESIGSINIIPQDIGRVILNLITNAFYVVNEKSKQNIDGYEPTVVVSTKKENNNVLIEVKDNGNGIPEKVLDKIFQPFFTTKPTGQGTGLGLSLSYDIIKAHGGEIKVNTKENEGTEFTIQLPIH